MARLARRAQWREEHGGAPPPQRARALLSAFLKSALRRPTPWIVGITVSIVLTILIALPWVLVGSFAQQAAQAEQVVLEVELEGSPSLEAAEEVFARIEQAVLDLDGIELVESSFEDIGGSLTVHFDTDSRDAGAATPTRVREEVRRAIVGFDRVEVRSESAGGSGPAVGYSDGSLTSDSQKSSMARTTPRNWSRSTGLAT